MNRVGSAWAWDAAVASWPSRSSRSQSVSARLGTRSTVRFMEERRHPGEATPVDVPAPAVAGAEPTGAAAAILTTAHVGLSGETGTMIWHRGNRRCIGAGFAWREGLPALDTWGQCWTNHHDPRRRIAHACYVHRRPAEP